MIQFCLLLPLSCTRLEELNDMCQPSFSNPAKFYHMRLSDVLASEPLNVRQVRVLPLDYPSLSAFLLVLCICPCLPSLYDTLLSSLMQVLGRICPCFGDQFVAFMIVSFASHPAALQGSGTSLDTDIRNERRLRSKATMQVVVGQQFHK